MKTQGNKMKTIGALCLAAFMGMAQGQERMARGTGGGNGGDPREAQEVIVKNMVKNNMLKIERFFLENRQAQEEFPEVDTSYLSEVVNKLIGDNKIVIISDGDEENNDYYKTEIHDQYGIARTAVNYPGDGIIYYDYEKTIKLQDAPKMLFVLNFHELLGLMGLEENDPNRPDLSMNYEVSGRLVKYVTKVEEYDLVIENKEGEPDDSFQNDEEPLYYHLGVDVGHSNNSNLIGARLIGSDYSENPQPGARGEAFYGFGRLQGHGSSAWGEGALGIKNEDMTALGYAGARFYSPEKYKDTSVYKLGAGTFGRTGSVIHSVVGGVQFFNRSDLQVIGMTDSNSLETGFFGSYQAAGKRGVVNMSCGISFKSQIKGYFSYERDNKVVYEDTVQTIDGGDFLNCEATADISLVRAGIFQVSGFVEGMYDRYKKPEFVDMQQVVRGDQVLSQKRLNLGISVGLGRHGIKK